MAQTPDVHNGFKSWTEYSRPYFLQRMWTLPTYNAGILTNFTAVVLTIATALLFILCQHMIQLCWSKPVFRTEQVTRLASNGTTVGEDSEEYPHTEGQTGPQISDHRIGVDSIEITVGQSDETQSIGAPSTPMNIQGEGNETAATIETEGAHVQRSESEPDERDSLLPSSSRRRDQPRSKLEILMSRETLQGVSLQYLRSAVRELKSGPESSLIDHLKRFETWKHFSIRLGLSIICFAFFVCFTIATIYAAQLASDNISRSASLNCGRWELDSSLDILSPFSYMQETESGDYARRCYNASAGADGCNFLFTQSIEYEEKNDSCPFVSGFCLGDDKPAYTLSTGLVRSQDLGINVPVGYTFNRTSTCAPIQRDDYYRVTEDNLIEYYYGGLFSWIVPNNLTWLSFPNYPVWTGPGYNVESFCRVAANGPLGWQPIPEFLPQTNTLITLMLVASQRIFHPEYRSDPVFPAMQLHLIGSKFFWTNDDLVATVFACTDHTSICTAAGDICWDVSDPPVEVLEDKVEKNGLYMLQLALAKSSICHSILLRGGAALDASTKLYVYDSLPLATEQWKVEAQNLFAASLAMIQISLKDHMRGSAAKEPGYVNKINPEHQGACDQYIFKSVGWTNVSVWGLLAAMLGSLMVFVLAFKIEIPLSAEENESNEADGEVVKDEAQKYRLVIEILGSWVWGVGKHLLGLIKNGSSWIEAKWNATIAVGSRK